MRALPLILTAGLSLWLPSCAAHVDLAPFQSEQPEYGLVQGPDGYYLTRQDSVWGKPGASKILHFGDEGSAPASPPWADPSANESDFYYAAASQTGCFISDRAGDNLFKGTNIWCVPYTDKAWGEAYSLPEPVNSAAREYSPVIRPNGDIYFASDREGGAGLGDIYMATKIQSGWTVERLGDAVNSPGGEWNLEISPNGTIMIFEASHRETNVSVSGDLYVSRRTDAGWSPAVSLSKYNTKGSDLMPRYLNEDILTFAQSRAGDVDLYQIDVQDLETASPIK